ncbi:MAG: hypothetical protein F6K17_14135 [Okeania sp. SIO3C4]|nr:hypothetical protein [Okeania sp. SIO3B3]NER03671.1 hypothetical protein [Okeania sp. SIO3C4]
MGFEFLGAIAYGDGGGRESIFAKAKLSISSARSIVCDASVCVICVFISCPVE